MSCRLSYFHSAACLPTLVLPLYLPRVFGFFLHFIHTSFNPHSAKHVLYLFINCFHRRSSRTYPAVPSSIYHSYIHPFAYSNKPSFLQRSSTLRFSSDDILFPSYHCLHYSIRRSFAELICRLSHFLVLPFVLQFLSYTSSSHFQPYILSHPA